MDATESQFHFVMHQENLLELGAPSAPPVIQAITHSPLPSHLSCRARSTALQTTAGSRSALWNGNNLLPRGTQLSNIRSAPHIPQYDGICPRLQQPARRVLCQEMGRSRWRMGVCMPWVGKASQLCGWICFPVASFSCHSCTHSLKLIPAAKPGELWSCKMQKILKHISMMTACHVSVQAPLYCISNELRYMRQGKWKACNAFYSTAIVQQALWKILYHAAMAATGWSTLIWLSIS